ncbi:diglucosyl diacylglycerol synthase [Metabacillus sp. GX 13764]|uniref:diglucosyl diacylglycerol synthase n=1 Tax=Metabacillus kandeliae TaxID=2900151 RepID=UPI001E37C359|nr:diglucosyl diacylglycerol synthase [Metabacillus kandeliae]MCD7033444.1 diglucosyl diacylglycerol synthase [Metabacillus kandeliae]
MSSNPKILILTARYGNGHVQVANTMYEQCKKQGIDNVVICDLYSESHPVFSEITQYLYLKSFSIGKQFYRLFYYGVDKMYNKRMMNLYYKIGHKKLHEIILAEQPDILINTFPMIVVPEYRRKTGNVIPTFNVLTDFCLHKIWVHENIDKYYVATNHVKEKIIQLGIHPSLIKVTGIPIRPQFEQEAKEEDLHKKYGLSRDKKTLLIMAGAHGVLKNVKELCQYFLAKEDLQIIVVCGKNQTLKDTLSPLAQAYPDRMKALGYVENVDELFHITSCMITKPGGITLSEAAALGVPVILYKPVPGQEKENAIFFEDTGSAVVVYKHEDIYDAVEEVFKDDAKLNSMKDKIHKLHLSNSSEVILDDLLKEAETMQSTKRIKGSVNYY